MRMLHRISRLIAFGESETLDFKQSISDASKISKTLVAFANKQGGTLLIGVRDNGSICGIRDEDDKYMLELAGAQYCSPKIEVKYTEHVIDHKVVIEARVEPGQNKPYYAKNEDGKWWVYHRVNDKSLQASAVIFQVLKKQNREQSALSSYSFLESQILNTLKPNNSLTVHDLMTQLNIQKNRIIFSLAKLIHFGIVKVSYNQKIECFTLNT